MRGINTIGAHSPCEVQILAHSRLYKVRNKMTKTICDICGKEMSTEKFPGTIKDQNFCVSSHGKIWDICPACRMDLNRWMTIRKSGNYGAIQRPSEEIIALLEKTYADFCKSEGGEGWFKIDGEEYYTDVGYAIEGLHFFMEVFKQRLAEREE